jgi:hypothetical protein
MGHRETFARPGARLVDTPPETCDLRDLEPPEPLVRILERIDANEGPHAFLLAREPLLLYPLLDAAHWRHTTRIDERGYLLTVYR